MGQTGRATVPRYVIEHYCRCFWEGAVDETNILISEFWGKQLLSVMWVCLTQSVEGPHRTKDWPPPSRTELCSRFPLDLNYNIRSCLSLQSVGSPANFGLAHSCMSQFLKINLFLYTRKHILLFLCLWGTLTNTALTPLWASRSSSAKWRFLYHLEVFWGECT